MGAILLNAGSQEQSLREIGGQVLHGHAVIGSAKGIEIQVIGRGDMAAEVVFVPAAGIENDRAPGRVGLFDQFFRLGGTDDADAGLRGGNRGERENGEGFHEGAPAPTS
jgi:hypothetical protein